MNPFLLHLWIGGLYRFFRRIYGVHYRFLGFLFLSNFLLMFTLHASARMLAELFIPLIAASAIFVEEMLAGIRWESGVKTLATGYLLVAGILVIPSSLPILPADYLPVITKYSDAWLPPLKEFNGSGSSTTELLTGRIGWDELARVVGGVYHDLPAEDRNVAGIYADAYQRAGAIDLYGPRN